MPSPSNCICVSLSCARCMRRALRLVGEPNESMGEGVRESAIMNIVCGRIIRVSILAFCVKAPLGLARLVLRRTGAGAHGAELLAKWSWLPEHKLHNATKLAWEAGNL